MRLEKGSQDISSTSTAKDEQAPPSYSFLALYMEDHLMDTLTQLNEKEAERDQHCSMA